MWQVIINKVDTNGRIVETRTSQHVNDELATDALLAASDAAMEYEPNSIFVD